MTNKVQHNSGNFEWYTPSVYVDKARRVMGSIDLDPASCAEANKTVQATKYFTKDDDGLAKAWLASTVWLNPPYSGRLVRAFVKRICDCVYLGYVKTAVVLVNNSTETRACQRLLDNSLAVCFPSTRISFERPGAPGKTPLQGQMICLLSCLSEQEKSQLVKCFIADFRSVGAILQFANYDFCLCSECAHQEDKA